MHPYFIQIKKISKQPVNISVYLIWSLTKNVFRFVIIPMRNLCSEDRNFPYENNLTNITKIISSETDNISRNV